jgi:hypothetical protein
MGKPKVRWICIEDEDEAKKKKKKKSAHILLLLSFFFFSRVAGNDDANNPLLQPVNLAFAPDGRIFVAEKSMLRFCFLRIYLRSDTLILYRADGRVRIIDATGALQVAPWIDLRPEVNGVGDRGLIGLTLHPNFDQNGYVYLLYTEDPVYGEPDEDEQSVAQGVLARYTENPNTGLADVASVVKIIGATYGSGFPQCHSSHAVGSVEFGLDGTLFVSSGDGSHWDRVDWGNNINQCVFLFSFFSFQIFYFSFLSFFYLFFCDPVLSFRFSSFSFFLAERIFFIFMFNADTIPSANKCLERFRILES